MAQTIEEEMLLIDAENNKEFKIIVSSEDAAKARDGKFTTFVAYALILEILQNSN